MHGWIILKSSYYNKASACICYFIFFFLAFNTTWPQLMKVPKIFYLNFSQGMKLSLNINLVYDTSKRKRKRKSSPKLRVDVVLEVNQIAVYGGLISFLLVVTQRCKTSKIGLGRSFVMFIVRLWWILIPSLFLFLFLSLRVSHASRREL